MNHTMKAGDSVYFLIDYDWTPGKVVKINPKSVKVEYAGVYAYGQIFTKNVSPEKIALEDEAVCVVWEVWKGKNGRGAYRVERMLYPDIRCPSHEISWQHHGKGRVTEYRHSTLNDFEKHQLVQRELQEHKVWLTTPPVWLMAGADRLGNSANFSYWDISGKDLSEVNLNGANLSYAILRDVNFKGTDLRGANFSNADLQRTNLLDTNLSSVNLWRADLRRAKLDCAIATAGSINFAFFSLDALPWLVLRKNWLNVCRNVYISEG